MKGGGAENVLRAGGGSGGNGGGQEKGVKAGGGLDMTNKMVVQGGCVRDDGDSDVGKRSGFSTMASYIPKIIGRKQMGSY